MEEYKLQVLENKMPWESAIFGHGGIKVTAQFTIFICRVFLEGSNLAAPTAREHAGCS
jgi:hypothetical protein